MIAKRDLDATWAELLKTNEFTTLKYNLLSNYRNADFDLSINETDSIREFLICLQPILKSKKASVITDTPFATTVSMLFEKETYAKIGFSVKIFSTKKEALRWLLA